MKLALAEVLADLAPEAPALAGPESEIVFDGVCSDSRQEVAGRLFIALAGDRFDGHAFVADVLARGARGAVVRRAALAGWSSQDAAGIGVDSPLAALQRIARGSLQRRRPRVIAITGSNGKTTTKDLAMAAFATAGRVHGTRGNLNNHIGVPLTVLSRRGDEEFLVAEAGANDFGELELLSRLLEPDAVIITNIGRAHLERFGNQAGVLRAKSELFIALRAGGVALLNADDPYFAQLAARAAPARVASFGFAPSAAYRIESAQPLGAGSQELVINGVRFHLPRPGQGNARNAAAALAACVELGGDLRRAADALAGAAFTGQRSSWLRYGEIDVLDDTYNANPDSMEQGLELLAARSARRIAVLGDMLELGTESSELHERVGREVAAKGIEHFLALGPHMLHAVSGAQAAGMGARARHFTSLEELVAALQALLRPGDAVLVKGSRGSRMERIVAALGAGVA